MANTCELKFSIAEIRVALQDQDVLYGLVVKELSTLARRLRLDAPMVWHLVDKTVERLMEEIRKFSNNPDKPYPPLGKNEMVIYVTLPEVGKLAQGVEWR